MYAIVEIGGKQYRVEKDVIINVDLVGDSETKEMAFKNVVLLSNDSDVRMGQPYLENVTVKATELRFDGKVGNLYSDGVEANIATFHDSITKNEHTNPTVPASVRSNLTTILGRMAAYQNGVVTWDEMMRRKEKFTLELKGLKA